MASVIVCGGSVIGLCTAMMLARDGHEVTVLEGDPDRAPGTPAEAWSSWRRTGVAQFHQPHTLFSRFREVSDAELPGLMDRLVAAGGVWVDSLETMPPTLTDRASRPGDDRIRFVTARRPVLESVVASAAEEQPGLTVRRGVKLAGLVSGPSASPGVPHAAGVRTASGEELTADLVVDAMGRRTPVVDWLAALGARPPQVESDTSSLVYYSRYFTGPTPPRRTRAALTPMGSFSILTLEGDNGTWSLTILGLSRDTPLKALRNPEVFDRVVAACPRQAHWLDGRPITGVLAMAGVVDCYRRLVVDGEPVVTGVVQVGDAWACTNPSAGRGLSVGLAQAQLLRRAVAGHLDDPVTLARVYEERTDAVVAPFYWSQVRADRARAAEMDAIRQGIPPAPPDPLMIRFQSAAMYDPDVYRGLLEIVTCLTFPRDVLSRPAVQAGIERHGDAAPRPSPGPDRAALLDLLTA
ncbi:FAD-dependent oxidoreductase [Blastococcus mobilis]|uniref:2-polyprenyl-6-methoxyphenol hydroxylase n=1 Tax=Blastococcus mobilis TaxID=1938746 RepID=A0A238X8X7_9ACTN|nr:FAD-dependent oxidoreductase [Blastococcus mobilis]SNR55058.1 2-polyprenyl-6-methoxyphenol hydroxylase [Blastococcus mobilis]